MTDRVKTMLSRIYANDSEKDYFRTEAEKHTLAHAYIIEGAQGSGKFTMAKLVCALISDDERAADLIDREIAADVMTVEAEDGKKQIGINVIRNMRQDAYIKPNDFDFKAYIIRYADTMTAQAQNAILKLLEEPPSGVYFFLLTENSAALLPTVRSRAPVIRMQVFTPSEIADYLIGHDERSAWLQRSDPEAFDRIVGSSRTIGNALEKLNDRAADDKNADNCALSVMELLVHRNRTGFFLGINALPQKREELTPVIGLLISMTRDLIYIKYTRNTDELYFGNAEKLTELSKKLTLSSLNCIYNALDKAAADLNVNMNVQNVKSVLASELWKSL